jgi:hypothetical protein
MAQRIYYVEWYDDKRIVKRVEMVVAWFRVFRRTCLVVLSDTTETMN